MLDITINDAIAVGTVAAAAIAGFMGKKTADVVKRGDKDTAAIPSIVFASGEETRQLVAAVLKIADHIGQLITMKQDEERFHIADQLQRVEDMLRTDKRDAATDARDRQTVRRDEATRRRDNATEARDRASE